jgi:4-azaleucine resistance transporter AzlC
VAVSTSNSFKMTFRQGAKSALPVILGYFPLAFAYGILAVQAGVSLTWTALMSVLVYAGAGQFMIVALLAAGADSLAIVLTVFVVNLRHLLMSAALAPKLGHLANWRVAAVAAELTDETFAIISVQGEEHHYTSGWLAGLQISSHLAWVLGSITGAVVGTAVTDPTHWGIDFALVAMFIALLAMQVRQRTTLIVAIVAGLAYRVALPIVNEHWAIITAAIIAATIGALMREQVTEQAKEQAMEPVEM